MTNLFWETWRRVLYQKRNNEVARRHHDETLNLRYFYLWSFNIIEIQEDKRIVDLGRSFEHNNTKKKYFKYLKIQTLKGKKLLDKNFFL